MRERVLITGGASGIGRAVAARCREDGYEPVVIDREAGEGVIAADLSDPGQTAAALAEALRSGPITRLVNNVGVVRPGPLEEQTLADLELVVSLNLRCAMQCAQALLPGMKEAGFGRIVNMASRAALGKELRTVYAATKAGLIGMAKVWALELGEHGITANAVGPGPIRTELFDRANPHNSPRTRAIIEAVPVRRLGMPEDVANAVAFLLDARSGFVTGQALYVCGGMTVGAAGA
ncbi:SDR family oxidoreductase [Muricoccus pecuniae]|uniref:NAD(P)-dependent dehydrogenase (Short-subunit alcohol dehydrogenase family) n=1 Tax=Muricoccus pecuniae TaxID=693023 RepID=A0A840Y579_9PROT|nr:SDR family oxidoreductase [Roseomonas pecuniae]MBB5696278.1 NAD(P)-dependent dehydrogenase (short-subunit alcohol dehydrogenase family) [Roseomonas pecuniae]